MTFDFNKPATLKLDLPHVRAHCVQTEQPTKSNWSLVVLQHPNTKSTHICNHSSTLTQLKPRKLGNESTKIYLVLQEPTASTQVQTLRSRPP